MAKRAKRLIVVRFREGRGAWECDYRDHLGKRHRPLYATEAEALEKAAELRKGLEKTVTLVDDPELTLEQYAERWLETGTQELEAKTRSSYAQLLKTHVIPTLGAVRLRDLHRRHVKTLLGAKRAERLPRKHTHQVVAAESSVPVPVPLKVGYSKNTVRLIKAALSTVLSDAVDDGYLETNPAFGAGRKRGKRAESLTQAERLQKIRPMSWQDRDAFLAAAASSRRYHALFSVLAKAGLRPGEAFALQPGDLELRARTLRVERAITLGARVKDTKTHDVRTVDLTQDLAQTLRRWLVALKAESLAAGRGEPDWLFAKADGTLMDKDHAAAVFRKMLRLAKLPDYRVYDCRHTYASLLLASGAPITYVSQQLGHSSPATTLRFYARWIPSKGRRWADVLDRESKETAMPADLEPESGTIAVAVRANA
jgi:integrase